jgi:hypothetical protein
MSGEFSFILTLINQRDSTFQDDFHLLKFRHFSELLIHSQQKSDSCKMSDTVTSSPNECYESHHARPAKIESTWLYGMRDKLIAEQFDLILRLTEWRKEGMHTRASDAQYEDRQVALTMELSLKEAEVEAIRATITALTPR